MGGGGGSSAGSVDYPQYLKDTHQQWLNHAASPDDVMEYSITDLMNAAIAGGSPHASLTAYDPDTVITNFDTAIDTLALDVAALTSNTSFAEILSLFFDPTRLTAITNAFAADLDAQLAATVYPRFEVGMRDLNAVMSSAFPIGRSLIEVGRNREVAKFDAEMRMKLHGELALQFITLKTELDGRLASLKIEAGRIGAVLKKEETDVNLEITQHNALWDLEVYKYGCNVMAAISGASTVQDKRGPSKGQSAVGGALSGAAVGTSISPGYGTVAGAVVGGIAGYLMAE